MGSRFLDTFCLFLLADTFLGVLDVKRAVEAGRLAAQPVRTGGTCVIPPDFVCVRGLKIAPVLTRLFRRCQTETSPPAFVWAACCRADLWLKAET